MIPTYGGYYLGAKAIAARLGYRTPKMVNRLVLRDGLPVYKRIQKNKIGCSRVLAISESALTAWELSKGRLYGQRKLAEEQLKLEQRRTALRA